MMGRICMAGTWPNSSAVFSPESMLAAALPFSSVHVCRQATTISDRWTSTANLQNKGGPEAMLSILPQAARQD